MKGKIAALATVMAIAAVGLLTAGTVFAQVAGPGWGFGRGGMMGGFGGMMGGWWNQGQPSGNPLSIDQAEQAVRQYVANSGYQGLALSEIMEFDNNFYANFKEKDTGVHAIELLVDRYGGAVYPEMGPNMMWNVKYGHMGGGFGGMMGRGFGWGGNTAPTADMPVKPDQATQLANDYLAQALPGTTAKDPETFYGYYTMDTLKDGKTAGMMSVNGYTGQVWYHSWHGTFIQDKDFEE